MFRFAFCLLLSVYALNSAKAQKVGLGALFGDPSGITLRLNNSGGMNIDVLAAWDYDDYFFINLHGLWEHGLSAAPRLNYYYGPGGFAGFRDRGRWENDDVFLGISGTIGLNLYIKRMELFVQATPRLTVTPYTDGDAGGGLGFRFYFN